jgi:hypothetical protein
MGWWSGQRNDYRSPLVELANTTSSVKGSTPKRIIVEARAASPSIRGAFTHFLNDDREQHEMVSYSQCDVRATNIRVQGLRPRSSYRSRATHIPE